jgi:hypothetical protein
VRKKQAEEETRGLESGQSQGKLSVRSDEGVRNGKNVLGRIWRSSLPGDRSRRGKIFF